MSINMKTLNGYTFDAAALGGKPPEYYLSPRNLLDNSDFTNPVNQRAVSGTVNATGYFLDRWKLVSGSVTISSDGITLDGTISQILENAPSGSVTTSASDGTASFDATTNTFSLAGSGVVIEWAALYEGEYTAATLPPYVPKGYAVELLECQRYYLPLVGTNCSGFITSYGHVRIMIPTNGLMRITPTIVVNSYDNVVGSSNGSRITVPLKTVWIETESSSSIIVLFSTDLAAGEHESLSVTTFSTSLTFDANL